jgi:hypothetical protein
LYSDKPEPDAAHPSSAAIHPGYKPFLSSFSFYFLPLIAQRYGFFSFQAFYKKLDQKFLEMLSHLNSCAKVCFTGGGRFLKPPTGEAWNIKTISPDL